MLLQYKVIYLREETINEGEDYTAQDSGIMVASDFNNAVDKLRNYYGKNIITFEFSEWEDIITAEDLTDIKF